MSMSKKAVIQCLFWLLWGAAAAGVLAAALSYHEYRTMAETIGSVIRQGSDSISQEIKENPDIMEMVAARGIKESSADRREDGERFLGEYGYYPMRNFGAVLPYTAGICILTFQAAGWMIFAIQSRKEMWIRRRTEELTGYLRAVNMGEGAVLQRREDRFSHLEDEIYKTVMELKSTKETAVRNHEVLADRIADIAHQLKTPLTSMSLMTELLEEYQTSETKEYYVRLSSQIDRLKNLVSGLLSLAKIDSHAIVFHKERILVSELIESSAEPLKEWMEEQQIVLEIENTGENHTGNDSYYIEADLQWTQEALMNIIKNCVEHTPAGGRIRVACDQNPIYTELRITDGGNGFAAKDLPHLFERFYRGEGASKDNAGIGLALAKAVTEQQNGHVSAENTADGHACFRMKWHAR